MRKRTFVIVGASLAGAKAAETLRAEGFDGRIVLLGSESERPYERPPLSKDYLRGEAEGKPYVHERAFYEEQDIELRLDTTVEALDVSSSHVRLAGGEAISFDRLLLATGAEPRPLALPGAELDGLLHLRTIADCEAIRRQIDAGGRLVTIGAGWIGAEVAASARQRGCEVTILERGKLPLERVLGPEVGAIYRDIHVEHGVEVIGEAAVEAIEGQGSVSAVRLADGRALAADFVVVGIGVAPRTQLAHGAGLELDNGVAVDSCLRTSAPNIFAAGDVANAAHPLYRRRIRVEHWANALNQGPAAARNMLGREDPYERIPYFFSDQYEVGMEYSGYASEWDEVLFRGDPQSREFVTFWLKDGRALAGMNVNVWEVNEHIQTLIRSGQRLERALLADTETPLEELAAVAVRG